MQLLVHLPERFISWHDELKHTLDALLGDGRELFVLRLLHAALKLVSLHDILHNSEHDGKLKGLITLGLLLFV